MATCLSSQSIRFSIATSADDFDAVMALWRAIYVDERQWLPSNPAALVYDQFHSASIYLVARRGDNAIGTLRVVMDSEVGLPVERFFPMGPLKGGRLFAEAQRLMVLPRERHLSCRGAPYGLWAGLVKACVHLCFMRGISCVVADVFTERSMMAKFQGLGFEPVGGPFMDRELGDCSPSAAMVLTIEQILRRAYRTRSAFFSYLLQFDDAFDLYESPNAAPQVLAAVNVASPSAGPPSPSSSY